MSKSILVYKYDEKPNVHTKINWYDTCIILYKREHMHSILNIYDNYEVNFDYYTAIQINNEFYDLLVFYKEDLYYNNLLVLRDVLAPYVKDGKPKGWFIGTNGEPQRYTGVANSLYFSDDTYSYISLLYCIKKMFITSTDAVVANMHEYYWLDVLDEHTNAYLCNKFK